MRNRPCRLRILVVAAQVLANQPVLASHRLIFGQDAHGVIYAHLDLGHLAHHLADGYGHLLATFSQFRDGRRQDVFHAAGEREVQVAADGVGHIA